MINEEVWSLEKTSKSYFFSIIINFDLDNPKLLTLLDNPSFPLFDISFINNVDLENL